MLETLEAGVLPGWPRGTGGSAGPRGRALSAGAKRKGRGASALCSGGMLRFTSERGTIAGSTPLPQAVLGKPPTYITDREVCNMLRGVGSQGEAIPKKCSAPHFHPMVSRLACEKLFSPELSGVRTGGAEDGTVLGGKERSFQTSWLLSLSAMIWRRYKKNCSVLP